ncbi:MAG TPA: hypothetical protein VNO30_12860 [Kofleriaceae bacterium]|nr:hypothetical protein [Kofleriaceae bacterium]
MNIRSLVITLAFIPSLVVVGSAQPCPQVVSPAAKQKAAAHFERGRNAYNFGNYDDAIREYQAAFDLTCAPEFVFNIAQTYRTKGDKRMALDFYQKYVDLDPNGDGVSSARSHIAVLEAEMRAEAAEAEAARLANDEAARRVAAEAAQRRVAESDMARRRTISRNLRIAGLTAGGAGIATVGASAFFGLRARTLSREASEVTGTWTDAAQRKVDRAESSERTMFLLLGIGSAVAITGGVLYFVGTRKTETAPAMDSKRITAAPVPGGAVMFAEGSF